MSAETTFTVARTSGRPLALSALVLALLAAPAATPPPAGAQDRVGIEGKPVSLDSTDPRYKDYFQVLRRRILEKWVYPSEAAKKNQSGSLVIEVGILRDGTLKFIEMERSSGVVVLDEHARTAVILAAPFPPIPEALLQGAGLPISIRFNYILGTGLLE